MKIIELLRLHYNIAKILIKYQKLIFVLTHSSKFGHFLINTENYVNENREALNQSIFTCEGIVDTDHLFRKWEKHINIYRNFSGLAKIYSRYFPFFFSLQSTREAKYYYPGEWYNSFSNFTFYDEHNTEEAKKMLESLKIEKYITITIRDSNYVLNSVQKYNPQTWRDPFYSEFIEVFEYLLNQGYGIIILNSTKFDISRFSGKLVRFESYFGEDLDSQIFLIKNATLHIGSCTAIDVVAFYYRKYTALLHVPLGLPFSTAVTKFANILPLKYFLIKERRFLRLSEYFTMLNFLGARGRFEFENQKTLGIIAIPNDSSEILNCVKESLETIEKGKLILASKAPELQQAFWNIYPNPWIWNDQIIHRLPTSVSVSDYYLKTEEEYIC